MNVVLPFSSHSQESLSFVDILHEAGWVVIPNGFDPVAGGEFGDRAKKIVEGVLAKELSTRALRPAQLADYSRGVADRAKVLTNRIFLLPYYP